MIVERKQFTDIKSCLSKKGKVGDFTSCIPYEGHENIAFTDYDIENLPF